VPLVIRLTRTSPTHHRFDIVRENGDRESRELETRSTLVHDLVHFAVETEARLGHSFYGMLARGVAYASLTDAQAIARHGPEILATERVVGALQGALKAGLDPERFVAHFTSALQSMDAAPPDWLDVDLVRRVAERMRRLQGEWRSKRFGESLELRFELPV
jgi:hypothetical protein